MYRLWVNVDHEGNIISAYGGFEQYVGEPLEEVYDYYFEVSNEIYKNIGGYQVENGDLIKRTV